MNEQEAYSDLL